MTELRYNPVLADAPSLVAELRPERLLVVGEGGVPDTIAAATTTRLRAPGDLALPTGSYSFFASSGVVEMLLVSEGDPPAGPDSTDGSSEDHPLAHAYGWFAHWWDEAKPVSPPRFAAGDDVVTVPSGQPGIVRGRTFVAGSWSYEVRIEGRLVQIREQSLDTPQADNDPAAWIARAPAPARRFAATLTRAKLAAQLSGTVYSFRASRTIFRPYQFRPVIRLLATGGLRLLIADEVGLGKTIEAGLVWTELDARNMANRVLVVCPSMLVTKWRLEMEERFGFELRILSQESLEEMLSQLERDRLPPRFHAVCSLERLRGWPGLVRLQQIGPQFDLVIVDEAHAFRNTETRGFALGALLTDWADALVFLTATPLNLGNRDLFNLLQLLAPADFDDRAVLEERLQPNAVLNKIAASLLERAIDSSQRLAWLDNLGELSFGAAVAARPEARELRQLLAASPLSAAEVTEARRLIARLHALAAVVTRTRKVEIEDHKAVREAVRIDVPWTEEEYAFYEGFEAWQVHQARLNGMPVGLVTQMPLRLASSCLPAVRERVLTGSGQRPEDVDLDTDDEDSATPDAAPPRELVELARRMGAIDTKFDEFLLHLQRIVTEDRRVLVFTFSRATLAYLERRLRDHVRCAVLHGDVKGDDRHRVMRQFREGAFDVLLASRVASEGLDFEFCSAVVNYDLPWNPMEVEQRIGRVDRFGQTAEKVLILNFHTPRTIETDIVARIMHRIGIFKASIGDLEPILQSRLSEIRQTVFDFELTSEQKKRRLDEMMAALEEQRLARDEIETASTYLSSTDRAEIDGLERDLLASGRYIGQRELVLLLEDWAAACSGASCSLARDGNRVVLRGTSEMEQHLRSVQARGERSAAELALLAQKLRDEQEIIICLDQELARTTGEDLLSANHPLTRAALAVPGHTQARFAYARVTHSEVTPGEYLVLLAIARWSGLRPSNELWAVAVELGTGSAAPDMVGAALLAALADGQLGDSKARSIVSADALERARRLLLTRQADEEGRRAEENGALAATRRISLRETHARKVAQIKRRIDTLRASGKTGTIRLHEAQLRAQEARLAEKEAEFEAATTGAMLVEYLAACHLEVVPA